ncbi:MAG: hypothetical protein HY202_01505 [Nitrospirae bacterium]|nr:hypothetical protein [Nitrospirota bacterium]
MSFSSQISSSAPSTDSSIGSPPVFVSPSNKRNSPFSSQAMQELLNIQKGSNEKNKSGKGEKKQINQDDIERLIHEGANKKENS